MTPIGAPETLSTSPEEPGSSSGKSGSDRWSPGKPGPERRCIVTGETLPPARLVRFVVSPEDIVTPDVAARLPGRGIWVTARREAVDKAVAKGLFARAAHRKVSAPADLADLVEFLLRRRVLESLGLARKAGELVLGTEKIVQAAGKEGLAAFVFACEGSPDGRRKLMSRVASQGFGPREDPWPVFDLFGVDELSLALGRPNVVHAALKMGRMTEKVLADLERLEHYGRTEGPPHEGKV